MIKFAKVAYVTILVFLGGYLCSLFTSVGVEGWYASFAKPSATPPNYVFPIMWNILYILLIIATSMILLSPATKLRNLAHFWFIVQEVLQVLWCWLFFGMGQLGLGLIVVAVLYMIVAVMSIIYGKINIWSGRLIYPYALWLLFAVFLNALFVYEAGWSIAVS